MDFTKEQLSEVLCKHAERENGLQDLMEIMIESMMVAERREYLRADGLPGDKRNNAVITVLLQDVSFGD